MSMHRFQERVSGCSIAIGRMEIVIEPFQYTRLIVDQLVYLGFNQTVFCIADNEVDILNRGKLKSLVIPAIGGSYRLTAGPETYRCSPDCGEIELERSIETSIEMEQPPAKMVFGVSGGIKSVNIHHETIVPTP